MPPSRPLPQHVLPRHGACRAAHTRCKAASHTLQVSRLARAVQPTWAGAVDVLIAPAIKDFVFEQALRVHEHDFLEGASHAAIAANAALANALRDDRSLLEELHHCEALAQPLYNALHDEVHRTRSAGDARVEEALLRLEREHEEVLLSEPMITETLLVIGAQRTMFPRHGNEQHQLAIGKSLVVCDASDDLLWSPRKQTELIADNGCSVQVTVALGGSPAYPSQLHTFEAAFDGDSILHVDGSDDDEPHVSLVDMNRRHTCSAFWSEANEVKLFQKLL